MTTHSDQLGAIPFPRVVRIEPAGKCNLSCRHCPTGTVDMVRGLMEWGVFEAVLSEIKANADKVRVVVLYHGGEPFLNKRFLDMVKAIKEVNSSIFVKTVSNGMAMPEALVAGLLECGLDSIEFSLDGESGAESNHVRKGSKSERVVENIKRLLERRCLTKSSAPSVYVATTQFIRTAQAEALARGAFRPGQPAMPQWLLDSMAEWLDDIAGFKLTYAVRWPHMEVDDAEFEVVYEQPDPDGGAGCDHVINTVTVRWDGNVVPCCYDLTSKLVMGNVMNESLSDIWGSAKYQRLRESILAKKYFSICRNCAVVTPAGYLVPRWKDRAPNPGVSG